MKYMKQIKEHEEKYIIYNHSKWDNNLEQIQLNDIKKKIKKILNEIKEIKIILKEMKKIKKV